MTISSHPLGPDNPTESGSRASRRTVLVAAAASAAGIGLLAGLPRAVWATQATPGAADETDPVVQVPRDPDHADIPYVDDGDPRHTLDIYLPAKGSRASVPVVVWIHGGAYVVSSKENVGVPYLLDDGYAIVSINYRLLQDAPFPAQIVDANAAISWVWHQAEEYGLDRDRLVVGGSSAGGTSSVLVAVSQNDAVPEFDADPDIRIAALIDFFGSTTEDQLKQPRRARGEAAGRDLLNAIQWVDPDDPPALIVHGEQDQTVAIEQSEVLAAALEDAGVSVTFIRYPELGHGMPNFQLDAVQRAVRTFLDDTLARS